jgi:hypothetical protein
MRFAGQAARGARNKMENIALLAVSGINASF